MLMIEKLRLIRLCTVFKSSIYCKTQKITFKIKITKMGYCRSEFEGVV